MEATMETPLHANLQGVVPRIGIVERDRRSRNSWERPQRIRIDTGVRRKRSHWRLVEVGIQSQMMPASGNISDRKQSVGDHVLGRQVPLENLRPRVGQVVPRNGYGQALARHKRPAGIIRAGIKGFSRYLKGAIAAFERHVAKCDQVIKDAERAPYRGGTVSKGVPCKSKAGFELAEVFLDSHGRIEAAHDSVVAQHLIDLLEVGLCIRRNSEYGKVALCVSGK